MRGRPSPMFSPLSDATFAACCPQDSRVFYEIGEDALIALREHRRRQIRERVALGPKWTDHNLVFPNTKGNPTPDSQIRNRDMRRILHEAGLRHVRPHDLRHTSATMLLESGVQAKVVQERLGHTRLDTTIGRCQALSGNAVN